MTVTESRPATGKILAMASLEEMRQLALAFVTHWR